MKLLYAIQGTGNGHIGRALELAPRLAEHAEIDFLISGKANELKLPFPLRFKYHGLYFIFGNKGGVDYLGTLRSLRPLRFLIDVIQVPVGEYDAIINDYEPVTAWASKLRGKKLISVSHQASFASDKVPRPKKRNRLYELAMKIFAPTGLRVATHYKAYDSDIYLPLIRRELIEAEPEVGSKIVVYLPAYADDILIPYFQKLADRQWQVFSKKCSEPYARGNVELHPVNRKDYSEALIKAQAVVLGSGFQGTSEALYLQKKILTIPMWDQYEQLCNAAALREFGVRVVEKLDDNFVGILRDWLENGSLPSYSFIPDPQAMASRIIQLAQP